MKGNAPARKKLVLILFDFTSTDKSRLDILAGSDEIAHVVFSAFFCLFTCDCHLYSYIYTDIVVFVGTEM